ncbi:diaminopimelate decarboxylase [Pedomonas mirosovicensis]|uniref:diaminopimelate decarboxylase n=1 Tax=Pedomonas mirosovicensis TaxID=2908641 RepID=UPI00216A838C|nr:diaminopimelate decarboxylase [Pedomonas mirosovicensis]MCH8683819.1 diaminopimelate decarboxylase [Pedomonas mirosovicensis]
MRHFAYRDGQLFAEDVPVAKMAEAVGTPFYCYSTATLERHFDVFAQSLEGLDALVCFAVKSNSNQAVISTLARRGAGADVVSLGELKRALAAGVPSERIVFSGVGKTREEMAAGLQAGIYQFNVESEPELDALSEVASGLGLTANIAFRVNPDVDAKTHAKISTGKAENKFGVPWDRAREIYARAAALPGIRVVGVDVHIGSQLTDLMPFEEAFARVGKLIQMLREDGHAIERADLGGGLGIPYYEDSEAPPLPIAYGAMVNRITHNWGVRLILEPGRLIVGNAGILVTRVIYVKQATKKTFVVVDAAMNDLIRPSLYDAHHDIAPVAEPQAITPRITATLVGPVCETGDTFATDREMPAVKEGDLVVLHSAGAYGAVMASTYNTRLLVPEVLVKGGEFAVVRPRPTYDDLIGLDRLPPWLNS